MVKLDVVGIVMQPRPENEDQGGRNRDAAAGAASAPVTAELGVNCQVRLKEADGDRVLTIGIGEAEARAIALATQGVVIPRPMTHDLLANLLNRLDDVSAVRVAITKRERGTFYAELEIRQGDRQIAIDCRPSDGIAIAVRLGIPIFAASALDAEFEAA